MDGIVQEVKEFIDNERLLQPHQKVLVAVSGGVDSIVLAYVLNEIGYEIGIAHANFQLRATDSEQDEKFTIEFAHNLKVPVYTQRFDTQEHANNRGISTQMSARELRYQWFDELINQYHYHGVATGHQADDVVETVLLNLTKGTGISGLHGILPQKGQIIRPLLTINKERIMEFAKSQGIEWREDLSNHSNYYQRNLIRNQVIPLLKQINPKLETSTRNTVEILRSVEQQYYRSLDQLRQQIVIPDQHHFRISKPEIRNMPPALLADLLDDYGFNLEQCRSLLQQALAQTGKIFYSKGYTLNVDREEIIISPNSPGISETIIENLTTQSQQIGSKKWSLSVHSANDYIIESDGWIGAFDFDKVIFPLKLRKWSAGDRFCPLGMSQYKKLSDFLIDSKVPVNYKDEVEVLQSNGRIIWVVGHRIDDKFKVTRNTRRVLEISVESSNIESNK